MATMKAKAAAAGLDFIIFENGMATAKLSPVDSLDPATQQVVPLPEGSSIPTWTGSDPSLVISPSADGLTALIQAGTVELDNATVSATCTLLDGTVITGTSENFDVVPQPPGAPVAFKIALSA